MIPIAGFAPDAEPTMPGLIADCENLIPSLVGMEGGPSAVTAQGVPALAAACQGAAVVTKLDDTRRVLAGTAAGIYEFTGGAWVDRTRSVGGAYTGGIDSRWSVAQFGDGTLLANRADTIQRSTSGAFANITGAPKASIVFSVGAFVMALNTNDGAEKPDGWHCCATFDDTDWTPSVTTQSASGRLVSTPGALTAGARLGEYAVAYKARSIFLGQYVGAPVVWDWTPIAGGEAGCVGKDAICDIGGAHFFVGDDNFWLFDGTRPIPMADGVLRSWFIENADPVNKFRTQCVFDRESNRVWVFYPSKGSSTLDSALVYHIQSKKWGRANRAIQSALSYVSPGITIDGMDTLSATIDALPNIPFDSQFWVAGGRALSVFDASNQLQSLTGASVSSSMTTGDVGDDDAIVLLQEIRLRYAVAPTSATAQTSHMENSGGTFVVGASGGMNDGKFDALKAARWHKARFSFTGPVRVTHMKAKYKPEGER
jgi:hypothetical protein